MRKFLGAFCVCAVLAGVQPAAAWPRPETAESPDDGAVLPNAWGIQERERATLREIVQRLRKGGANYAIIAQHLREALENPAFATLTAAERRAAYLLYGSALYASGQYRIAEAPFSRATRMPQAGAVDWDLRFKNAFAAEDYADAAVAATTLAKLWPQSLARYDERIFATIVTETRKSPDTAGLAAELLSALGAAHLAPVNHPEPTPGAG